MWQSEFTPENWCLEDNPFLLGRPIFRCELSVFREWVWFPQHPVLLASKVRWKTQWLDFRVFKIWDVNLVPKRSLQMFATCPTSPRGAIKLSPRIKRQSEEIRVALWPLLSCPVPYAQLMYDVWSGNNIYTNTHKYSSMYVYIYIPRTQTTLVLIAKDLVLGGLTFKNRGHWGSIQKYVHKYTPIHVRWIIVKVTTEKRLK